MSVFKQLKRRRLGKQEARLDREINSIERLMEDESYQNTFLTPELAQTIAMADNVDCVSGARGKFAFDMANPVPVNGPLGALTYLSRLKTIEGERLLFQCVGGNEKVQIYEAVTYSGKDWFVLFLDLHHPRKSHLLPDGFELSGDVAMFSGFVDSSSTFPEDYSERVLQLDPKLVPAYAPDTRWSSHFGQGNYERPLVHWAKLDALASQDLI